MHGAEPNAIPAITETRVDIAQQEFPFDSFCPGRNTSEFLSARLITEQIDGSASAHDRIVDHHRRDQILEISIRPGDEGRYDHPDIIAVIFAGTDGGNREQPHICASAAERNGAQPPKQQERNTDSKATHTRTHDPANDVMAP